MPGRPDDIKNEKDKDYNRGMDRDAVVMEGWLMKRNQRGVEWWKKRYFVLKVRARGHGLRAARGGHSSRALRRGTAWRTTKTA